VTDATTTGPVLFCYDGSQGSRNAMKAAADLLERPVDAVVLTVWDTIATRLALAGAFAAGLTTGGADLNEQEESSASKVAEEGARHATEHGYVASALTKESFESTGNAILEVADETLRPPNRLRPTRPRAPAERPSRQCLAPAGVTRPASRPHRPRELGVTEVATAPWDQCALPRWPRSADAALNITQTV
jgi:hypothetical protein